MSVLDRLTALVSPAAALRLAAVLAAVAVWDLAHGFELFVAANLAQRVWWGGVKYVGIAALPAAWWTFVVQYAGRRKGLPWPAAVALAVVPVVVLGILVLPSTSWLIHRYRIGPVQADSGPLFWPFVAYTGACLLYTSPSPRDRQKSRMPSSA